MGTISSPWHPYCVCVCAYKELTFVISLHPQQLQQAVEKRNEIIARLSSNLQEALASRDQVQLEAQSLAGQIQALQKQLQQVSATQKLNLWQAALQDYCSLKNIHISYALQPNLHLL